MSKTSSTPTRPFVQLAAFSMLVGAFTVIASPARADERPCEPPGVLKRISGKIFNNAIGPGDTLGTVHGAIGTSTKLKCGIQGKASFNPDGSFGGFTHTIVCDDSVAFGTSGDTIHSQIVAETNFAGVPNFQSCGIPGVDLDFGTFRELSFPLSGRGIFSPTGGGRLVIDGTLNCAGAIDMKFSGEVCVVR